MSGGSSRPITPWSRPARTSSQPTGSCATSTMSRRARPPGPRTIRPPQQPSSPTITRSSCSSNHRGRSTRARSSKTSPTGPTPTSAGCAEEQRLPAPSFERPACAFQQANPREPACGDRLRAEPDHYERRGHGCERVSAHATYAAVRRSSANVPEDLQRDDEVPVARLPPREAVRTAERVLVLGGPFDGSMDRDAFDRPDHPCVRERGNDEPVVSDGFPAREPEELLAPDHPVEGPVQRHGLVEAHEARASGAREEIHGPLHEDLLPAAVVPPAPADDDVVGVLVEASRAGGEIPGVDPVVIGEPHEQRAAGGVENRLEVRLCADVGRLSDNADPRIRGGELVAQLSCAVRRGVVRDDELELGAFLGEHRPDRALETRSAVSRRDPHAHERAAHRGSRRADHQRTVSESPSSRVRRCMNPHSSVSRRVSALTTIGSSGAYGSAPRSTRSGRPVILPSVSTSSRTGTECPAPTFTEPVTSLRATATSAVATSSTCRKSRNCSPGVVRAGRPSSNESTTDGTSRRWSSPGP